MLKNLIIYRIGADWTPDLTALNEGLQRMQFAPCAPTQPASVGWIEPRGEAHAPLVESVGGQWILRLKYETKMLPASVVSRRVEALAKAIEEATGRKPGKRQKKELKEQAQLELLPMAFTKEAVLTVWIDPVARILAVDAASQSKADDVVTALIKACDGLNLMLLQTQLSAESAMSGWIGTGEGPVDFSIDRDCELRSHDEMKSVVRYARHSLDAEDVRGHIQQGKVPTRLAMTWKGRVAFNLTASLALRKIEFLDGVFENRTEDSGFDADVAIATGELRGLIADLIEVLGGEMVPLGLGPGERAEQGSTPQQAKPQAQGRRAAEVATA